ncbi:MAG: branched-chain amino acid ABC transporter permease, partial [Deltaproteobacteria bacterium]|nr:branched-chain amino acid ABC transporter permease [Deltaproteobacteria bacterium]
LTRLYLAAGALALLGVGYVFLQKSWYGRCIRALVQRPEMASVMGVNVRATACVAFAASFCYLAVAAYFFMFFLSVEPHTGHNFLPMCFLIAVMGSIGNLLGSLCASFIIGVFSAFVAFFLPGYHDPIIFLMFIGVLLFRPNGLFGEA